MQTSLSLVRCVMLAATLSAVGACAQSATPTPSSAAADATALPAEVFDVLSAIQQTPDDTYSAADVGKLFHAVWWDLTYSPAEEDLARRLHAAARPASFAASDGRTLEFTKRPDAEAANRQRFLLVGHYMWQDSTYFVQGFRNTKDADLFIAACRVHENAAAVMESMLITMANEARFAGKNSGNAPLLHLFSTLEASCHDANPTVQGEFAAVVRRVVAKLDNVPAEITQAAWLQASEGT